MVIPAEKQRVFEGKVITCGSARTGQDESVPPDIIRKLSITD